MAHIRKSFKDLPMAHKQHGECGCVPTCTGIREFLRFIDQQDTVLCCCSIHLHEVCATILRRLLLQGALLPACMRSAHLLNQELPERLGLQAGYNNMARSATRSAANWCTHVGSCNQQKPEQCHCLTCQHIYNIICDSMYYMLQCACCQCQARASADAGTHLIPCASHVHSC